MGKTEMEIARDILIAALHSEQCFSLNGTDTNITPESLGEAYKTILADVHNKDK